MRIFLLSVYVVVAHLAFGQNRRLDSLHAALENHPKEDIVRVNLLNELSLRIFKSQPDKALNYAKSALTLAQHLAFQKGIGQAKNNMATYHSMRGDADVAVGLALEAVRIGEQENQKELLAHSYFILSAAYHSQLDNEKALLYLVKAHRQNQQINNALISSKIFNSLGVISMGEKNYDSALFYYEKSISTMKEGKEDYSMPEALLNIATVYDKQSKDAIAAEYFSKALTTYHLEITHITFHFSRVRPAV